MKAKALVMVYKGDTEQFSKPIAEIVITKSDIEELAMKQYCEKYGINKNHKLYNRLFFEVIEIRVEK